MTILEYSASTHAFKQQAIGSTVLYTLYSESIAMQPSVCRHQGWSPTGIWRAHLHLPARSRAISDGTFCVRLRPCLAMSCARLRKNMYPTGDPTKNSDDTLKLHSVVSGVDVLFTRLTEIAHHCAAFQEAGHVYRGPMLAVVIGCPLRAPYPENVLQFIHRHANNKTKHTTYQ